MVSRCKNNKLQDQTHNSPQGLFVGSLSKQKKQTLVDFIMRILSSFIKGSELALCCSKIFINLILQVGIIFINVHVWQFYLKHIDFDINVECHCSWQANNCKSSQQNSDRLPIIYRRSIEVEQDVRIQTVEIVHLWLKYSWQALIPTWAAIPQ